MKPSFVRGSTVRGSTSLGRALFGEVPRCGAVRSRARSVLSALCVVALLSACVQLPENALLQAPQALERRQIESRKFVGVPEANLLSAVGGVLQDLGFTLESSETKLGLIVAEKERDAHDAGEIAAAITVVLLGGPSMPVSRDQRVRVSVVVLPTADKVKDSWRVRATFQRVITRTDETKIAETLLAPALHQEFFEKLSKSVFLEAQRI